MRKLIVAIALLCGCPPKTPEGGVPSVEPSATAAPSASAEPEAALKGGWSIELTSASPGVDPALFDTPEKKAKAFYDHTAKVEGGRVQVDQRTLGKSQALDPAAGKKLEDAVLAVDWKKLAVAESGQVGGTVFHFKVTVGGDTVEVKTGKLKDHPELKAIATLLKEAAGAP